MSESVACIFEILLSGFCQIVEFQVGNAKELFDDTGAATSPSSQPLVRPPTMVATVIDQFFAKISLLALPWLDFYLAH